MAEPRTSAPIRSGSQRTHGGSQYRRSSFRRCDRSRRTWSDREELVLISALKELVATGWKSDNGFRGGYGSKIEEWLRVELPTTDIRVNPHIQSKISTWKKNYYSLTNILNRSGVGFNLHNDFKIDCSDDQWDQIMKQDINARTMRTKSWPFWDDWKIIFGKDRATGGSAEGVSEAVNNDDVDEPITSIGESGDYYPMFEDFLGSEHVQPTFTPDVVDDNSAQSGQNAAQSGQNAAVNVPVPKKTKRKRNACEDDSELINLLGKLHDETNVRLDTLSARIGYEMDLGKYRQDIFRHLENIPGLTETQMYDLCDIIGKENSRLEIFTGLPDVKKPGYVKRILEKEALH